MKLLTTTILLMAFLAVPHTTTAQTTSRANRAWKPFFASLNAAVKKRDNDALMKMMSRDFYYLSSGGDENSNHDTRDEAFEYWENAQPGAFEALEKVLAEGTVPNTTMREPGSTRPNRIGPPAANKVEARKSHSFPWYVVFEYRNGRWYWIAFTECCDQ